MLGTHEAIRQSQQKERREEHRARRCNLIVRCIKSSQWSRELDGRPLVLRNGAIYIDTCAPSNKPPDHQLGGYFLPYPDTKHEGFVTTTTDAAPIMNWVYVHTQTHQMRYGVRKDAQPHLTGPFDCTRQERRLTLLGWEGFCAVEVEPGVWGAFFDIHDDGLKALMDDGLIGRNTRVLEIELMRAEKRFKKDPTARNADQTINRGKVLNPDGKEVIVEPAKPASNGRATPHANAIPKPKPTPVTPAHSTPPTPSSPPPLPRPAANSALASASGNEKANTHHVRQAIQRLHQAQGGRGDDTNPTATAPPQLSSLPDVESVHPLLRGHEDPLRTTPPNPAAQASVASKPVVAPVQKAKVFTPPASPDSQSLDFEELLQARSSPTFPQTPPSPAVVRVEAPVVLATYGLPEEKEKHAKRHKQKAASYSQPAPPRENKRVSKPPSAHANSNGGSRLFASLEPPPLLHEEPREGKEEDRHRSKSRIMPSVMKMLRRGSSASESKASTAEEDSGNENRGIGKIRRSLTLARPRRSESQSGESTGRESVFRESIDKMRARANGR